jgi:hypothetical protein
MTCLTSPKNCGAEDGIGGTGLGIECGVGMEAYDAGAAGSVNPLGGDAGLRLLGGEWFLEFACSAPYAVNEFRFSIV